MEAEKVVTRETVSRAMETLRRFRAGKANLDSRIVENEQWWKRRHWDYIRKSGQSPDTAQTDLEPTSGWLFNSIANKHADAMDNFPEPNIRPHEAGDRQEALHLTSIVPVLLDQNGFRRTYSKAWWRKLKTGTAVYGVFWNPRKLGGMGDVEIRSIDLLNLFWEPGVEDIQESSDLFYVTLQNNRMLEARYPQLRGRLTGDTLDVARYVYDDTVDTVGKTAVVDWYYKTGNAAGQPVLHYCQFAAGQVLYASQDDPTPTGPAGIPVSERGFYDHGRYPFVLDPLFPVEGTPAGFGYVDVCKSPQTYIDTLGKAILKNALAASTPRYFVRSDAGINEEEFLDLSKPMVHYEGSIPGDALVAIPAGGLPEIYMAVYNSKIEELKETSGNRDVSSGGTSSGVTAASAIAAMQEAGSKLSRDMLADCYEAYRQICLLMIELIRQFYSLERQFRIVGAQGAMEFISYSNRGLRPQRQTDALGNALGYRVPQFDIEVTAQKSSPYAKMSQNELAIQLYQLGFFNPELADQALAALEIMDFDTKSAVEQTVQQNGTLRDQVQRLQMAMAQVLRAREDVTGKSGGSSGKNRSSSGKTSGSSGKTSGSSGKTSGATVTVTETNSLGAPNQKEHAFVVQARQRVAESTAPR